MQRFAVVSLVTLAACASPGEPSVRAVFGPPVPLAIETGGALASTEDGGPLAFNAPMVTSPSATLGRFSIAAFGTFMYSPPNGATVSDVTDPGTHVTELVIANVPVDDLDAFLASLQFVPYADFATDGADADFFAWSVEDDQMNTVEATSGLDITPVADVVADAISTTPGVAKSFDPRANDNWEGEREVVACTQPEHGTVTNTDAQVTYTPDAGYSGPDTFDCTIAAVPAGSSEQAAVMVTVEAGAPSIVGPATAMTDEDSAVVLSAYAVTDADSSSLTATLSATHGTLSAGPTITGAPAEITDALAMLTFTPDPNFAGDASLAITVSDGEAMDTATTAITVHPVNDLPVAADDTATVEAGMIVDIDVLANDTDVEGFAPESLEITSTPTLGSATTTTDGRIRFSATAPGTSTFTYQVADTELESVTAMVTVTITAGSGVDPDRDNDDILNEADNCPNTFNPDQADEDGDGTGDVCDDDDMNPGTGGGGGCAAGAPNGMSGTLALVWLALAASRQRRNRR